MYKLYGIYYMPHTRYYIPIANILYDIYYRLYANILYDIVYTSNDQPTSVSYYPRINSLLNTLGFWGDSPNKLFEFA